MLTLIPRVRSRVLRRLARVGYAFEEVGNHLGFYGTALFRTGTDIVGRLKYRNVVLRQVSEITVGAGAMLVGGGMIFVVFVMAFFTGTEVGLQGFKGLQQIGAQSFIGLVGGYANLREVTPIITGIALAAQVGARFTAEIGAMRVSEEIDALEVMSVPSFQYLVCTRLAGTLIALIPLYLISLFGSFFATRLVSTTFYHVSPGIYDYYFHLYLPPIDVLYSVIKVIVFALAVVLIHCQFGYNADGGPVGVGVAVGRAIRMSIITIVCLNLLLSFLFWGTHNTVSLTG